MPVVNEAEMLAMLDSSRRLLLVEPPFKTKYMPLGLAKIAGRALARGAEVEFSRVPEHAEGPCDLICVTTLFTTDLGLVGASIRTLRTRFPGVPILVGGVCATLMQDRILAALPDVLLFSGYSRELDVTMPAYDFPWGTAEPWDEFAMLFSTRGCRNHCPYCAVWRLEPGTWINPAWKELIATPTRPHVMMSDNNLLSHDFEHAMEVLDFLPATGKRFLFDNGLDCKLVNRDVAERLARIKFIRNGCRMAFDRIKEDGVFQRAVETAKAAGVSRGNFLIYVLFNFRDTPQEANYRFRECVRLRVQPYPQQYQPLTATSRTPAFVGRYWTAGLLRAFRLFYLLHAVYPKKTFEQWAYKNPEVKLTSLDWQAWMAHPWPPVGADATKDLPTSSTAPDAEPAPAVEESPEEPEVDPFAEVPQ